MAIQEQVRKSPSGFGFVALILISLVVEVYGFWNISGVLVRGVIAFIALCTFLSLSGFFTVDPNQSIVMQLFGKYVGTVTGAGFYWDNPLLVKRSISLQTQNFETNHLKVNDLNGNPVEIAAIIVWKVFSPAEAVYEVANYGTFLTIQSESALRGLATKYPYEAHGESAQQDPSGKIAEVATSLSGNPDVIAGLLKTLLDERLHQAGVEIVDARLSHLAYAPEVAAVMLQRQQATAIVAARRKIVEGAVSMVEDALQQLEEKKILTNVEDKTKAQIVGNLLVVLCGERAAQPVVNATTSS